MQLEKPIFLKQDPGQVVVVGAGKVLLGGVGKAGKGVDKNFKRH